MDSRLHADHMANSFLYQLAKRYRTRIITCPFQEKREKKTVIRFLLRSVGLSVVFCKLAWHSTKGVSHDEGQRMGFHAPFFTEFLDLKHTSRILGQSSNPVCGFSVME